MPLYVRLRCCRDVLRPNRVVRGGSWNNSARNCRSAYRNRRQPGNRNRNQGFRVCLVSGTLGVAEAAAYSEASLREAGWFAGNSNSETHAVGEKAHNDFGLYDMHGNVREWCRDAWDNHAYHRRVDGVRDPIVDHEAAPFRVVRGGSWDDSAGDCRSAYRDGRRPGYRSGVLG